MSSKNVRNPSLPYDNYVTPKIEVKRALRRLSHEKPDFEPKSFLEPGAGPCTFCDVAAEVFSSIELIKAVELNPNAASTKHQVELADFLTWETRQRFNLVAGNPPFSLAEPFLRRSLELMTPDGLALLLLRVGFLGGIKRQREIWSEVGLRHVWVISHRVCFAGKKTDSENHAWYLFDRGRPGEPKIGWINRE